MKDRWITYNPKLKQIARTLRNNMTLGEILLWKELKGKKLSGYDFHRQKPIDEYIVDFYCPRLKLVVEIDGDSHDGKEAADKIRQDRLESLGLTVMRFWDADVKSNVDGIVEQIKEWIESRRTHPCPSDIPSHPADLV
jgi:very-short-patch-repair endonuclease